MNNGVFLFIMALFRDIMIKLYCDNFRTGLAGRKGNTVRGRGKEKLMNFFLVIGFRVLPYFNHGARARIRPGPTNPPH